MFLLVCWRVASAVLVFVQQLVELIERSRCVPCRIGLLARAGGLIALLCISCMVLRLLLICDVESALSLLAASSPMSGLVGEGGRHRRMMAVCETTTWGHRFSGLV